MKELKQLIKDTAYIKSRLILKAKQRGIYENFGQQEINNLTSKYFDLLHISNVELRLNARIIIDSLDKWASSYNGN